MGIASTCSVTGAHRLTRDVLSKGDVDLFFIEFAVNDDQDAGHDITHAIGAWKVFWFKCDGITQRPTLL